MSRDNNARYQEILRRIESRREQSDESRLSPGRILDDLNVLDVLTPHVRRKFQQIVMCGHTIKHSRQWSGVMLWYRQRGAGGYRTLYLFGVWVLQDEETFELRAGIKTLPYSAPVYVAEAYHKLIKKDFTIYYDDKGAPPETDDLLYHAVYNPDERLKIRADLEAVVEDWQAGLSNIASG